jgi:hypothetical protein
LRWIKCPWNPRLRCYESNERTCPFSAREYIRDVERWAGKSGDLRSRDLGLALGSTLPKARDNEREEFRALESAWMYCLFRDPDAVLDWFQSGSVRMAPMPKAVCDDLKVGFRKWKTSKAETTTDSVQEIPQDTPVRHVHSM